MRLIRLKRAAGAGRLAFACLALGAASLAHAANCFVTEFGPSLPTIYQAALQPPLAEQVVAIGGSSTASSLFQANTVLVRITCDASASIEFGTAPTASATMMLLPSGVIEYFTVPAGGTFKVAVITNN